MYRPGCLEHYVLHQLRNDPAFVPELDFVMTLDGQLIDRIIISTVVLYCLMKVKAESDELYEELIVYIGKA